MFIVQRVGHDMFNVLWKCTVFEVYENLVFYRKFEVGLHAIVAMVNETNKLCVLLVQSKMAFVIASTV